MSFLANLRQQNAPPSSQLLLYWIELREGIVHLSLALGELRNGLPTGEGQPYAVQALHLESPPAFLNTTDFSLLRQLCHNGDWLNRSSGQLSATDNHQLLTGILVTQRCFMRQAEKTQCLQFVRQFQPLSLLWRILADGRQQLQWQDDPAQTQIRFDTAEYTPAFVYHAHSGSIQATTHPYCAEALNLASCQHILAPDAVNAFLERAASCWQELQLPLPLPLKVKHCKTKLQPVLYCHSISVEERGQRLTRDCVSLLFRYSGRKLCIATSPEENASTTFPLWDGQSLRQLQRHTEKESEWLSLLQHYFAQSLNGFHPSAGSSLCQWHTSGINNWLELIVRHRTELKRRGVEISIDPHFSHQFVEIKQWRAEVSQQQDAGIQLSLNLDLQDGSIPLTEIIRQIREFNGLRNDNFIQLQDGRILLIPANQLVRLSEEFGDLAFIGSENIRLHPAQLNRLQKIEQYLPKETLWQDNHSLREQAINIHRSPAVLDSQLCCVKATLRPYQWLGLCWLQHLSECRVNGLLADDMGLGKTLQTLAFLAFRKSQGELHQPALIVLPTSLLHNWAREIAKFTPQLTYAIMHGPQRHDQWQRLCNNDIILTSYQLIVNDIQQWAQLEFSWLILDEAHTIKNPHTQISQAMRELTCHHRLCLTGTPVENHLGELWALFDFLMPGCLGNRQEFNQHFRQPIEKQGNQQRMSELLERIAPFVLRRSKDQVAKHLPPKTTTLQTLALHEEQYRFYEEIKHSVQLQLTEQLNGDANAGQQHILLLSAILKLRQACCDPALLNASDIPSAKREYCIEMLQELVDERRSVLVFSQFTSMLDLLAADLSERGINYLQLTGKTQNRQTIVDNFQNGTANILLMSLKAGGVGLNLTRADTVIHYDPWWNDAAERQASDRAHRIGQDKPVFVYKLIAENTIEEKIAHLQEYKASLSESVNTQAQATGARFALAMEDLLALINE